MLERKNNRVGDGKNKDIREEQFFKGWSGEILQRLHLNKRCEENSQSISKKSALEREN